MKHYAMNELFSVHRSATFTVVTLLTITMEVFAGIVGFNAFK